MTAFLKAVGRVILGILLLIAALSTGAVMAAGFVLLVTSSPEPLFGLGIFSGGLVGLATCIVLLGWWFTGVSPWERSKNRRWRTK